MNFRTTAIDGVVEIDTEVRRDERGSFARAFCAEEMAAHGIAFSVVQANLSSNAARGTLRGMHYQAEPVPDPKIVRCVRGRVFDVALDLRRGSPTLHRWTAVELDAERRNAVHIPAGCAHGFLTLSDDCELFYLMGAPYVAELARGVRWDDPVFAIEWPEAPRIVAPRDATFPYQNETG
ncbi:MAG: dTDP-4-dehydrorhamnose 3,5-epimerase [Alphaproteobacteria bacterium]